MNLNTILQILYANKLSHVVSLAIQIENNIPTEYKVGDKVRYETSRSKLPEDKIFEKDKSWGIIEATILAVNIYSLEKPYFITLPDGSNEWIGEDNIKNSDLTPIINKEVLEQKSTMLS